MKNRKNCSSLVPLSDDLVRHALRLCLCGHKLCSSLGVSEPFEDFAFDYLSSAGFQFFISKDLYDSIMERCFNGKES